jgi:hypothetical protein
MSTSSWNISFGTAGISLGTSAAFPNINTTPALAINANFNNSPIAVSREIESGDDNGGGGGNSGSGSGGGGGGGTVGFIPTARIDGPRFVTQGRPTFLLKVKFRDNTGINRATVATGAIAVTGPNGFLTIPKLFFSKSSNSGTAREAWFIVKAPGGTWNAPDAGRYTVSVLPHKVADINGNFVQAANIGSFFSF